MTQTTNISVGVAILAVLALIVVLIAVGYAGAWSIAVFLGTPVTFKTAIATLVLVALFGTSKGS